MGVRVPPSAPRIVKILSKNAGFRRLGTTKVQTPVVPRRAPAIFEELNVAPNERCEEHKLYLVIHATLRTIYRGIYEEFDKFAEDAGLKRKISNVSLSSSVDETKIIIEAARRVSDHIASIVKVSLRSKDLVTSFAIKNCLVMIRKRSLGWITPIDGLEQDPRPKIFSQAKQYCISPCFTLPHPFLLDWKLVDTGRYSRTAT